MTMKRAGSGPSLSHPELAESFPILFEIRGRVVVDFVLFQEGVDLHSRFEAKQPPKLRCGKCVRPVCFERRLSSAARGRSFHLDSSPWAMSSGSSNVICIASGP